MDSGAADKAAIQGCESRRANYPIQARSDTTAYGGDLLVTFTDL
jgi:hypothetical protein